MQAVRLRQAVISHLGTLLLILAYLGVASWMWVSIAERTGSWSYTLDDPYIHGAIARNIAEHGSFGIIPGEFAGASSSILWTLSLGVAYLFFGPAAWVCGAMATIFGMLAIERTTKCMELAGMNPISRTIVTTVAIAAAPILPILSTGMEHCMHIWALTGLLSALMALSKGQPVRPGVVFVWAFLAAGSRYESLFFLPGLMIWLTLTRRWRALFELAGGMGTLVVGFGIYSTLHGGFFLPNTLMHKGTASTSSSYLVLWTIIENIELMNLTLGLLIACIWSFVSGDGSLRKFAWLPCTILTALLIHLRLARTGSMWRYESYLMVVSVIGVAPLLGNALANLAKPGKPAVLAPLHQKLFGRFPIPRPVVIALAGLTVLLAAVAAIPLSTRSIAGQEKIVPAAGNIHDQQIQMSRVVQILGDGAGVGVNDLGAVSFFTNARILDLWGLGDDTTARAVHAKKRDTAFLRKRIDDFGADFVIAYPVWFDTSDPLPRELIPVEKWILDRNVICGNPTVTFYGRSPGAAVRLREALDEYHALAASNPPLPHRVTPLDRPTPVGP
jgi:hypothetical protein